MPFIQHSFRRDSNLVSLALKLIGVLLYLERHDYTVEDINFTKATHYWTFVLSYHP